jgi:integrase
LLTAAKEGDTIFKMTGFHPFALYSMALGTGLRASELASLTPQSFDLNSDPPTVRILAKNEKSRRGDTLPLPLDLAILLSDWVPQFDLDAKLWPGTWAAYKVASKFIQHDLKVARAWWVETAQNDAQREEMEKADFSVQSRR